MIKPPGGVQVEHERVQMTVDASGTAMPVVVAQWVAAQASAYLDGRATNPVFADIARALDVATLLREFDREDRAGAHDALVMAVTGALRDTAGAMDPMAVSVMMGMVDSSVANDLATVAYVREDGTLASDVVAALVVAVLRDHAVAFDSVMVAEARVMSDTAVVVDSGRIHQQSYFLSDYFADDYFGEVSNF